jgi:hypothetical protein
VLIEINIITLNNLLERANDIKQPNLKAPFSVKLYKRNIYMTTLEMLQSTPIRETYEHEMKSISSLVLL